MAGSRSKNLTASFLVQLILLSAAVIFAPSLRADIIVIDLDPMYFGDLDQHNTDCPHQGCGPAAAVNSFVYLQNRYPGIYNVDGLVAAADPSHPTQAEQAAVANDLLSYMKTCCNNGTYWGNFIVGKQDYLDTAAPGTSDSSGEGDYSWDTTMAGTKPKSVKDNTIPTIGFILNALQHNRDLELMITDSDGNNGHFITITGITWDTDDMSGYISYVDPKDGMDHTSLITGTTGDPLDLDYGGAAQEIRVAVEEGPIPEPSTFLLLGSGLIGICGTLRLKRFCLRDR